MHPVELERDGVRLRPWTMGDVADVHRMVQDPQIPRFMDIPADHTLEGVSRFTASTLHGWERDRSWSFAITDAATAQLVGSIALDPSLDDREIGEIGYWLGAEHRGKGYASRAVRMITEWGFEICGLSRIQITTHPDNEPSRQLALACGYAYEGALRGWRAHHGRRVDLLMYSRLRDDPPMGSIG